jgi:phage-related protein
VATKVVITFEGIDNASKTANEVNQSINTVNDSATSTGGGFSILGEIATGALRSIGAAAVNAVSGGLSAVVGMVSDGIKGAADWESALAQTNAVIKSTGGAAGLTAGQFGDLASRLSAENGMSKFSDDAILAGENILATFVKIKGPAFTDATQTILDMSTALGTDLGGTAMQVGKALNDPIAGIGALSRVGVTFTDQQKEQIKSLSESGNMLGAQRVILAELATEFGGSAAASVNTFSGQMIVLQEQTGAAFEQIGTALLPVLVRFGTFAGETLVPILTDVAKSFGDWITTINWDSIFTSLNDFYSVAYDLVAGIDWARIITQLQTLAAAIQTGLAEGSARAAPVIARISEIFTVINTQLEPIAAGMIAAFNNPAVQSALKLIVDYTGVVVQVLLELANIVMQAVIDQFKVLAPVFSFVFNLLVSIVNTVFPVITAVLNGFLQLLRGDTVGALNTLQATFQAVWDKIKGAVSAVITSVMKEIGTLVTKFTQIGIDMATGIVNGINAAAGKIKEAALNAARGGWEAIKEFFRISSPSVLMAETIGKPFSQGIAAGIVSGIPDITGASRLAGAVAGTQATTNNYYQLAATYNTNQSESSIMMDLRDMQRLAGA